MRLSFLHNIVFSAKKSSPASYFFVCGGVLMLALARKISLSFRQAQIEQQKKEFQKYLEGQSDRLTLGDLLKEQLKNLTPKSNHKKEGE